MPRLPVPALLVPLLALLLGAGGCSTTVFETIPNGATTDCDPAWPGRWQPVGPPATADAQSEPKDVVEISADCRSVVTKGEPKPLRLTLVTTRAGQFLQVHNDDGKPDCIGDGKAHCGFVLVRYERDGDTIRIYDPDHAAVASAINKGKLKGFSERADGKALKTSEPTYRNFIGGDGNQVEAVLRRHPELFGREPLVVLQRVAAGGPPAEAPPSDTAADGGEPVP